MFFLVMGFLMFAFLLGFWSASNGGEGVGS